MIMCRVNVVALLVLQFSLQLLLSTAGGKLLGCPLSRLQVVTVNETLLPRTFNNVQAQIRINSGSLVPTSLLHYGPNSTSVYCAPVVEDIPQPIVTLIFTQPIVVVGLISGGYTYPITSEPPVVRGLREYVSRFTVETSQEESGDDYSLYRANQVEGEPEVVIGDDNINQLMLLDEPFMARRVRLQILDSVRTGILLNITCWNLAFVGYHRSEALFDSATLTSSVVSSPTISISPTPPMTTVVATSMNTGPCGRIQSSDSQSQSASSRQILSIVLPVSIATVLIVTTIVTAGVIICVRGRAMPGGDTIIARYRKKASHSMDSMRVVDSNTLVKEPEREAEGEGRERAETVRTTQNDIYGIDEKGNDVDENSGGEYEPISRYELEAQPSSITTPIEMNYTQIDGQVYSVPCNHGNSYDKAEMIPLSRNESYGQLQLQDVDYSVPSSLPKPAAASDRTSIVYEELRPESQTH